MPDSSQSSSPSESSSSKNSPITPASSSSGSPSAWTAKSEPLKKPASSNASAAAPVRTYVPIRPAFRPLLPKPPTVAQVPAPVSLKTISATEKDTKPKKKAERKPSTERKQPKKKTAPTTNAKKAKNGKEAAPLPNTIAPSSLITKKKRSQSLTAASKKNKANMTAAALLSATTTTTNDPNDSLTNSHALRNDSTKVMLGGASPANPLFNLDTSPDLYLVSSTADDSLISLWDPASSSPDLQQSPVDSLALMDDIHDDNNSDISSVYSEPLLSLESYLTPEPDEIDPDMHTVNDSFAFLGPAINI
ncbi:hypothetical protein TRVA0_006S00562 [Trichomonascus vanleenenianus]|uniref:uncharacterized protein n=1 Tax=Trichomonascus vanleenenianus TaxID=2268995 RepID=UPI003ECAD928